jgi:transcriptional regulator with XRE-family HTH domain
VFPYQVLKQTRRDRNMTMEQLAETLGLTTQRISQFERGATVPLQRIREWAGDQKLPDWARAMAKQMWLAALEQQYTAIGEQIAALSRVVATR